MLRMLLSPCLALLTHAAVQHREPYGHHAAFAVVLYLCSAPVIFHWAAELTWSRSLTATAAELFTYVTTLTASIVVYRLFLHPLRNVPGPWWAKASMWAWVPIERRGLRVKVVHELHQRYGTVVRIGPRWVSINDEKLLSLVYGATTVRGPLYEGESSSDENCKGHCALLIATKTSSLRDRSHSLLPRGRVPQLAK